MQFRQGDVFLNQVNDVPELEKEQVFSVEGPTLKKQIILAHGEATGHKHAIKIKNNNALLFKAANDNRFFLIVRKESDLTHEEHSKIKLPVGNYEVIRQREYTPESIRWVVD